MLASIFLKLKSNNLKIEIFNNKTPTTSSVEHEHKTPAVTVRGLYAPSMVIGRVFIIAIKKISGLYFRISVTSCTKLYNFYAA